MNIKNRDYIEIIYFFSNAFLAEGNFLKGPPPAWLTDRQHNLLQEIRCETSRCGLPMT